MTMIRKNHLVNQIILLSNNLELINTLTPNKNNLKVSIVKSTQDDKYIISIDYNNNNGVDLFLTKADLELSLSEISDKFLIPALKNLKMIPDILAEK